MNWWAKLRFLQHAWIMLAGSQYWLLPLLPLGWLVVQAVTGYINDDYVIQPQEIQGLLMGAPMTAIAVYLGIRIIGGEIDDRSLEVAYTVPGGAHRLWLIKLGAAFLLLLITELILAPVIFFAFGSYPPGSLYGAMQPACFYLVLSMALAALCRGEAAGAIVTLGIIGLNALITEFGNNQLRISPFYNPYVILNDPQSEYVSTQELLAWTIQNRIGMLLAMAAITALAFMRADRRERMLDGS